VKVHYTDHSHALGLILLNTLGEICHVVNLNESVYVQLQFVYVSLHKVLYTFFSKVHHKITDQGHTQENNDNVSIDFNQFHKKGIDSDPKIGEYDTATEYAHKLIVIRDSLVVLVAESSTTDYVD
jgi:hypothetical protein